MLSFWIHLVAFWEVAVMNCIQPINWKYCYRVDQWLLPEIQQAWEIKTGKYIPYQDEQIYLDKVNGNKLQ
tara:strand:+ start:388 stop:597 length:210 start_codon:yes stop_codon:yes gene_type:complete